MAQDTFVSPFTISAQVGLITSGTSWAQLKTGGVKVVLDNLIAANPALAVPTVAATVGSSSAVSSLPLATGYIVSYTWCDALGETTVGASASTAFNQTSATTNLNTVTIPSLPTGAQSANIYLTNPASGATSLYAEGVTATTFAMSYALQPDQPGAQAPPTNTTGGAAHSSQLHGLIGSPHLELLIERFTENVSNYLSGYPMEWREVSRQAHQRTGVFGYWFQVMREIETLILANSPTAVSTTLTPIGFPVQAGSWTLP